MSQDMQIKQIEINITLEDLVAFNRYVAQRSPQIKRGYQVTLCIVPVALLVIAALLYKTFPTLIYIEAIISILWIVTFPRFYWRLMDNNAKRILNEGQNKGILGKHLITISELGLHETTDVNVSQFAWAGFDRVERNEQYLFAFISTVMAHIIPLRAFSDSNQANEFYSAMKNYIEQAKQSIS